MRGLMVLSVAGWLIAAPSLVLSEDATGVRPLLASPWSELRSILPKGTQILHDPAAIARFLDAVDGAPPDWTVLHGPDGAGHDERLFALNRWRDRMREGHDALTQPVTFFWAGALSGYDPSSGGFRVAIGPQVIPTRWGLVRFKPEELPSELVAIPTPALRASLLPRVAGGESVEIGLAMTGRLVPQESIVYDFAHEDPGLGMVMPVVRIERVDYLLR